MASLASTITSSHPDAHLYIPSERIPLELHHHRTASVSHNASKNHVDKPALPKPETMKSNRISQFFHNHKTTLIQHSKSRLLRIYGWLDNIDTTTPPITQRASPKRMTHRRSISAPLRPPNAFVTVTLEGGLGRWAVLSSTEHSQSMHSTSDSAPQPTDSGAETVYRPIGHEGSEPSPPEARIPEPHNTQDPRISSPPSLSSTTIQPPPARFPPRPPPTSPHPQDPDPSTLTTTYTALLTTIESHIRSHGPSTFKPPCLLPRPSTHPDHNLPPATQLHLTLKSASQAHAWAQRRIVEGIDASSLQPLASDLCQACLELVKVSTKLLWCIVDGGGLGAWELAWGVLGLMASFHRSAEVLPADVLARVGKVREGLRGEGSSMGSQRGGAGEGGKEVGRKDVHMGTVLLVQWLREGGIRGVEWGFVVTVVGRWVRSLGLDRGVEWDVVARGVELPVED